MPLDKLILRIVAIRLFPTLDRVSRIRRAVCRRQQRFRADGPFLEERPRLLWVSLAEAVNPPGRLKDRCKDERGFQQDDATALTVQVETVGSTPVRSQEDWRLRPLAPQLAIFENGPLVAFAVPWLNLLILRGFRWFLVEKNSQRCDLLTQLESLVFCS
ncbi:hypothetical protein GB937_006031 [Aspergillus fischeri]|nr:hypothetical protein GB937_006031 [Aspergillus fischeri]